MKKGAIIGFEALVPFLYTLLITIALIFILAMFLNSLSSNKTPEEQDFERIAKEMDELIKAPEREPQSITVPIQNPNGIILALYREQDDFERLCKQKPCLCAYYKKEGKEMKKCKVYEKLNNCGKVCIDRTSHLTLKSDQKTATITRRTNEITIT